MADMSSSLKVVNIALVFCASFSLLAIFILVVLPQLHDGGHVELIEGGQHCIGVLRFLQPAGDLHPHPVHLHKGILVVLPQLHDGRHVQLIECGQHCIGVLRFLQPAGDLHPHPVHLHPVLAPGSCNLCCWISGRHS